MNNQKEKWEALAADPETEIKYIYTDAELDFRASGKRDYEKLIRDDFYIRQFLSPYQNKNVLEIGCGTGRMTEFIAAEFNQIYATDISGEMIRKGQERLPDIKNIKWIETDGLELPENIQVDLVFSYIVLQHCSKEIVQANLKGIRRILADTGIAKIQVRGIPIRQDMWYSGDWFEPEEIKGRVHAAGLEVIDTWHDPIERRYLWIWIT